MAPKGLSVVDFLHLGSSLSVRAFSRIGNSLSVLDMLFLNAGTSAHWTLRRPSNPATEVTPIFMLAHDPARLRRLESTLLAVSDPASRDYGRHLFDQRQQCDTSMDQKNGGH